MKRNIPDYEAIKPRLLEMVQSGHKSKDIAKEFGISEKTVSKWKKRCGMARPKASTGTGSKNRNDAKKEDTPATINMCLHCEEVMCYGWCCRVARENNK